MAPADSARVVICIIALASVGLAFILLRKYRRPKKSSKSSGAATTDGYQEETPVKHALQVGNQQAQDGSGDCGCEGDKGMSVEASSTAENGNIGEGEASVQDQTFASLAGAAEETKEESLAAGNLSLSITSSATTNVEAKKEPSTVESSSSVPLSAASDTEINDQCLTPQMSSPVSSAEAETEAKQEEPLQGFESALKVSEDEASIQISNNQLAHQVCAVVEQRMELDDLVAKSLDELSSAREVTNSPGQTMGVGQIGTSGGDEDVANDFAKDQHADAKVGGGVDGEDAVQYSGKQAVAYVLADEDTESVQSGDVSSGDGQSFEQISSNNEREGGQDEAENSRGQLQAGMIPDFVMDSMRGPDSGLPSFENVGADDEAVSVSSFGPVENSSEATDTLGNENNDAEERVNPWPEVLDSLPSSFDRISMTAGDESSLSFEPVSSSIEVIQSSDFTGSETQSGFVRKQDAYSNTTTKVFQTTGATDQGTTATAFQNTSVSELSSSLGSIEVIQLPASDANNEGDNVNTQDFLGTADATVNDGNSQSWESSIGAKSSSSIEVIQPPSFGTNDDDDTTDRPPSSEIAASGTSSGVQEKAVQDMNNSIASVEVVRQATLDTGSIDDLQSAFIDTRSKMSSPSSESFQSLEQFEGSTTSGSKQDFFSLSNSPEPGQETLLEGYSSDDLLQGEVRKRLIPQETMSGSTSFDTDLDFTTATESPPDRTPTNTPTLEIADKDSVGAREEFWDSLSGGAVDAQDPEALFDDTPTKPKMVELDFSQQWMLGIDKDKITDAVTQAQAQPDKMTIGQLQILVEMLKQDDVSMLDTALQCIVRVSAFTTNVEVLQVCQCPVQLTTLLQKFAPVVIQGAGEGVKEQEKLLLNITRAINNLAMDMKSQAQLEGSIPVLTDLLVTEGMSEDVTIGALQPLTNLSASPAYHKHYTSMVQQLYAFLDTSHNMALRLQCLKVLVNLSLNSEVVPHLLAARAPECLLELLDVNANLDLLLRTVTFLANILSIMQEKELTASSLPPDHKAPSPETLYSALFALDNRDTLRNKVFRLTRHQSENVTYQASRLYEYITKLK